ncbi:uncharacterized protein LOC123317665 [Coccinella septempunctata]|uniref:uncharacterized protein LOC123317665 n=1 Tax=Coccinella septempunctata TaxID=41139 RepID=UPI001D07184A|nr:uncharacterized protein LOC123317665 [Coccinella septempunctata]
MLSHIAQLFDQFGLVSPVTIRAKMLLQELWLQKLSWDEPLSPQLTETWCNIREDLKSLINVRAPRWVGTQENATIELQGFSDASQLAMAAVLYLIVRSPSTGSKVTLLCSKTKVTPLKRLTIPLLELTASLILARLTNYAPRVLDTQIHTTTLWTNSTIYLTWITSHPARWKDFVRNRVELIQELTPGAQWRYVSGKENPADYSAHKRTLHGGTKLTLSTIRQQYWIIGGRAPVKSHILKCVTCARHRGIRAQQLMGQLPEQRVRPSRPFLTTDEQLPLCKWPLGRVMTMHPGSPQDLHVHSNQTDLEVSNSTSQLFRRSIQEGISTSLVISITNAVSYGGRNVKN